MRKRHRAFTLAEVITFIFVVAVASLALLSSMSYLLRSMVMDKNRHTAGVILYSRMAYVRYLLAHRPFNQSVAVPTKTALTDYPGFLYKVDEQYQDAYGVTDPSSSIKRISMSVYWTEEGGEMEYSAWTCVYKGP